MANDHNSELWKEVDDYFKDKLLAPDPYLETVLTANDNAGLPRWEVSALQAQFLSVLILATGARRVLEVGTLGGFSTIFLGRAIPQDGRVISLEIDKKHARVARENIAGAGLSEKVEVRTGKAAQLMKQMAEDGEPPFDMVFIDADKRSNPIYMRLALRLTRCGALIVTDNVVRGGAVVDPEMNDPDTNGVRELIDLLSHEPGCVTSVVQNVGIKGYDGFAVTVVTESSHRP